VLLFAQQKNYKKSKASEEYQFKHFCLSLKRNVSDAYSFFIRSKVAKQITVLTKLSETRKKCLGALRIYHSLQDPLSYKCIKAQQER
tara:strand:- start:220 stop:480 length:261 start_codon:yes stop_codon:yes gene_type:complete